MTREAPSSLTTTTGQTTGAISTPARRLAAARVRRDTLVLSRGMMHAARASNADVSAPLEPWTPARLLPYLPFRLHEALRREPPVGTAQPALYETFDDAALGRVFSVLRQMTLLPNYGEAVAPWRRRIAIFEQETGTPVASLAAVERDKDFPGTFAFS